jgi:hypothetical protein
MNGLYIIDTHVLVWYFLGSPRLKGELKERIDDTRNRSGRILVPTIVLAEALYVAEKGRAVFNFDELYRLSGGIRASRSSGSPPKSLRKPHAVAISLKCTTGSSWPQPASLPPASSPKTRSLGEFLKRQISSCLAHRSVLVGAGKFALAGIDHLGLLRDLFGDLLVPEAVWEEVVVTGAGHPGARLLEGAIWVTRHQVTNQSLVQALQQELDASEAEQARGA